MNNITQLNSIKNNRFEHRLLNDNSFIVARNVHFKENNTCDWGSGYYYNSYDDAYKYYVKEFVKPFIEYDELFIK